MAAKVTQMFGIEYPIFAFTHCRDVAVAVVTRRRNADG
jgi:hypothetical protein